MCSYIFSKATNSVTYVLPSTCFPKRNIENIPEGGALSLRRICDSDSKFWKCSAEYQNYLLLEIINPAKSKNSILTSKIFQERQPE